MRKIKNLTYHNFMYVIRKIEERGYNFDDSAYMAKVIFREFGYNSNISIEERINKLPIKNIMTFVTLDKIKKV